MIRKGNSPIGEAIEKWLDALKLRRKYNEVSVINAWEEVMGKSVSNRTQKLYVRDKKLYVHIESAVVKNELAMMRKQIIGRLNEHIGQVVVEELIIM